MKKQLFIDFDTHINRLIWKINSQRARLKYTIALEVSMLKYNWRRGHVEVQYSRGPWTCLLQVSPIDRVDQDR